MIVLKGFFRKKTTKIYLIIFSVLLVSTIIVYSFVNYYKSLASDLFKESAYVIVASKNNYYDMLIKNKNITNIEEALLFNPDYTYDIRQLGITWERLRVGGSEMADKSILIFPSKDLTKNEISIGFNFQSNEIDYNIIGKKIQFYIEEKQVEFIISNLYKSLFAEMAISENIFQELSQNTDWYIHKITLASIEKANSLVNNLEKLEKNKEGIVSLNIKEKTTDNGLDMAVLKRIIDSLTIACYLIVIIVSIILFTITNNIIIDEYKNMSIERLLGYNKKQIRKNLCFKTIVLNIMAYFIATTISIIIIVMINRFLDFKLVILDLFLLLTIYSLELLITLLLCLFSKVKTNQLKISD